MRGDFPRHSPRIATKAALCAALALSGLIGQGAQARDRDPAEEAQRWQDVREPVFHARPIQDAGEEVKLIAPDRAMDAALVPLTVELHAKKRVTAVTVFIDNNPAPVVGTFRFGPAISPDQIKFRVRINDYTLVHAVAETEDGALLAAEHYVKAAGGARRRPAGKRRRRSHAWARCSSTGRRRPMARGFRRNCSSAIPTTTACNPRRAAASSRRAISTRFR